jgi:CheY-like chemotaxis protein
MKKRILIVDDDPVLLEALSMIMEKEDYDIETSLSGRPLLEELPYKPDLIILDKRLSGMDGLEICRHLKQKPATRNIPVILVSAVPNLESVARRACADDFIEKPFNIRDLLDKVAKYTEGTKENTAS